MTPAAPHPAAYDAQLIGIQHALEEDEPARAAALAAAAAATAPALPEAYLLWGRALAHQDLLEPSAEHYQLARARGSRARDLFVELGNVLDVLQRYDEAIVVYRDWLRDHPQDLDLRQELGLTLLLTQDTAGAIKELQLAAKAAPRDRQLQLDLGQALTQGRRYGEAIQLMTPACSQAPLEACRFMAQAQAGLGQLQPALALLDRLLTARPQEDGARALRAQLRLATADARGALADYELLRADDPSDAQAQLGAAAAQIALQDFPSALKSIALAARQGDSPRVQFRRAQVGWRTGDRQALATLLQLAQGPLDNAAAWAEVLAAGQALQDSGAVTLAKIRGKAPVEGP